MTPANNDGTIGEIEDLIIKMDGTVQGVVIGVGGFLGIGEKKVAVEMSTLQMVPRDDGGISLELNYTREQLEKAPIRLRLCSISPLLGSTSRCCPAKAMEGSAWEMGKP